ncbi:hypothetical protein ZHAS_00016198 [Anopheles sinensis]|uniref:Uncharacterized protein n=1 Tax=Anopheles sinensis TaxID=74873 RepID=A0A084WD41_ANOSI|nr:hypothetical protein ZHAS_00016198 [Anopheles sinensis]
MPTKPMMYDRRRKITYSTDVGQLGNHAPSVSSPDKVVCVYERQTKDHNPMTSIGSDASLPIFSTAVGDRIW